MTAEELPIAETGAQAVTVCRYPPCENPPKPGGGRGRKPEYCGEKGHNPQATVRYRDKLVRDQLAAINQPPAPDTSSVNAVTDGQDQATDLLTTTRKLFAAMRVNAEGLVLRLETVGDPTSAAREVESVRARATAEVAAAKAAQLAAEQAAGEARADREEADRVALEALDDAEQARSEAATERERADAARQEADQATAARDAAIEKITTEAAANVKTAEDARDAAIEQAAARVEQVEAKAAKDVGEANERAAASEKRADERVAAAKQSATEAAAARDQALSTLGAVRQQAAADVAEARAETERVRADGVRAAEQLAVATRGAMTSLQEQLADLRTAVTNAENRVRLAEERAEEERRERLAAQRALAAAETAGQA